MNDILNKIANCREVGKINKSFPFPANMKDQDGADELTKKALEAGIKSDEILEKARISAMVIVGNKFSRNDINIPQMLMSAKAMGGAMLHLKPFFHSVETKRKGTFIIGTVIGGLHGIGKNLVSMMVEGGGREVIDFGMDVVGTDKFLKSMDEHPGTVVGLSALLTTKMENMKKIVIAVKEKYPDSKNLVGGASVTQEYCNKIGADFYSPDPQGAVNYLKSLASWRFNQY
jgi:methanogenic corrinoid protein MtbC1